MQFLSVSPHFLLEAIDLEFESLFSWIKPNVAYGFILRKVNEDGCRCHKAQQKNKLMDSSNSWLQKKDLTKNSRLRGTTLVWLNFAQENL